MTAPRITVIPTSCQLACMLGEKPTANRITPTKRIHHV